MNKKIYIIVIIMISMLLIGCSNNYMTSIYDNNEKISSDANSFNLDINEQSIEGQQFKAQIKKIEGMDTIWSYESDEDKILDITYLINVKSGKLKLVLISPDNSVNEIIEQTKKSDMMNTSTNSLDIKKGLNRIKIVGDKHTSVDLDIKITQGDFEKLGM